MLDCATQLPKIGATMSFSRRTKKWHRCPVLWPKGKVRLLNACVFHGCNFLKWDLMGLVFVFKKINKYISSKVSWSLIESHDSMTARVKGVGKLFEHLRDKSSDVDLSVRCSRHVSARRWVWSSWSLGHPRHGSSMSQYVTVWSCAVPMWRVLSEMRRLNLDYMDKETWEPFTCLIWWRWISNSTENQVSLDNGGCHVCWSLSVEKDGALGRLNGWLVKSSHWHLTSCHLGPSWIPTYFSATGLAVEVLPQACSKKRVSFSNQRGSLESFAGVLHSLWWSLSQLLLVMGDLKLYFGGRFVV